LRERPVADAHPVDRVEVHVLVDNVTDSLSTVPSHVENEWSYLWRNGMKRLSGRCICCAAHGLSCLITAYCGESRRTILIDTGPEEDVFERNVSRLGDDLGTVEGIVLSHGHWDHAGGMLRALDLIRERNGGREVPFYAHPGMYETRAMKQPNGSIRLMEDIPSVKALTAHGARVVNTREPQSLSEGMFYVSGEIPRVTAFEHGFPGGLAPSLRSEVMRETVTRHLGKLAETAKEARLTPSDREAVLICVEQARMAVTARHREGNIHVL